MLLSFFIQKSEYFWIVSFITLQYKFYFFEELIQDESVSFPKAERHVAGLQRTLKERQDFYINLDLASTMTPKLGLACMCGKVIAETCDISHL